MRKQFKIEKFLFILIIIKLGIATLIMQSGEYNFADISFGTSVYAEEKDQISGLQMPEKMRNKQTFSGSLNLEILKSLEKKENAINQREKDLQKQEEHLKVLRTDIEKRLHDIEKAQRRLEELAAIREDLVEKSINHLAKVYSSMRPEEAGPLIEKLEEDITIQILRKMKSRSAGKILARVKPSIAARLSEEIARRK
jgi:flagellar motility protein MotE (MotC chaperone)